MYLHNEVLLTCTLLNLLYVLHCTSILLRSMFLFFFLLKTFTEVLTDLRIKQFLTGTIFSDSVNF